MTLNVMPNLRALAYEHYPKQLALLNELKARGVISQTEFENAHAALKTAINAVLMELTVYLPEKIGRLTAA